MLHFFQSHIYFRFMHCTYIIFVYGWHIIVCALQAEEEVEEFLRSNRTFDEYTVEVRKYYQVIDEILYSSARAARLGMFEV